MTAEGSREPGCALGALALFATCGLCLYGVASLKEDHNLIGLLCGAGGLALNVYAWISLRRRAAFEQQDPSPYDKRVSQSHMVPLSALIFLMCLALIVIPLLKWLGVAL